MSEPETITLPRSGVPLTPDGFFAYESPHGAFLIDPESWGGSVDEWQARHPRGFSEVGEEFVGTRDGCIEWLDSRVLALRSALLAGAEETVAQAMWTHDEWNPKTLAEADESNIGKVRAGAETYRSRARAVIAALCGEEGSRE